MKKSIKRTIATIVLIGIFLLLVYLIIGRPMISFLGDADKLQEYVNEKGIVAILVLGCLFLFRRFQPVFRDYRFILQQDMSWNDIGTVLLTRCVQ